MNIPGSISENKKFSRRDLEKACRKVTVTPTKKITKRQRAKPFESKKEQSDSDNQLKSLDAGVKLCARKYNECKSQADKMVQELGKKMDEQAELEREASVLQDMIEGKNHEAKKIAKLTKDIDSANTESDQKMRYRLQLNHMYQRQRRNSVAVDAHMSVMATSLSSAERERDRCHKMLGEIDSSMANAIHEFEISKRQISNERAQRQKALNSKKHEASGAESLELWRKMQESNQKDFEDAFNATHQREKEAKLNQIREREKKLKEITTKNELKAGGEGSSEESFMHIKKVTGVNSYTEMVEKFINHQELSNLLQMELKDTEERLASAREALEMTKEKFEKMKTNGFGDTELNRDLINEINDSIENERSQAKIAKSTNSRLECILMGLRQGGLGLYQRLLPFHPTLLDGDAPIIHESTTATAIEAATDTLEMLKVVEEILGKMLDACGGIDKVSKHAQNDQGPTYSKARRESIQSIEGIENPNLGENNCRIQAKDATKCDETISIRSNHREETILEEDPDNCAFLTRARLKANSEQQAAEAKRLMDQELKQQKMEEKLLNGENGQATVVAKKMQEESTARMSKHHLPIGLPKSVSMRDDPFTKAKAFLTELPTIE